MRIATDAKGPNVSTCCMVEFTVRFYHSCGAIIGTLGIGYNVRNVFCMGSTFPCFLGALSCALYGSYVEMETFFGNFINVMNVIIGRSLH